MTNPIARLHQDCAALGTILFTVTTVDRANALARRAYTSHPAEYPAQGTKPMERDEWFALCIEAGEPYIANTPEEFSAHFFDHALITSMGLGSVINIPVRNDAGVVVATVNLLAGAGHFTPDRAKAYETLVATHRATLLADPLIAAL